VFGIVLLRWLVPRFNDIMELVMFVGSPPVSWLVLRAIFVSWGIVYTLGGMSPTREFVERSRFTSFEKVPSSEGMVPLSWLFDTSLLVVSQVACCSARICVHTA
jgi:hypothetical protein